MKAVGDRSWAGDIRRQIYELVALLALLVVIAAGYDVWSHVSIERVRVEINDHHLVANSHYLRAMEELRNLQGHHGALQQLAVVRRRRRRAKFADNLGVGRELHRGVTTRRAPRERRGFVVRFRQDLAGTAH